MATWSKKTYEMVARVLRDGREPQAAPLSDEAQRNVALEIAAEDFADQFAADNPAFDRERFLKAAGVQS